MRASATVTALAVSALVVAALFIGACGGGPTDPGVANLRIMLTDNHTDELEAVNVFFTELRVKRSGEPVERGIPIVLSENPQDLLVLADQVVPMAAASVDPGSYEFIRIELDQQRSNVVEVGGVVKPLRIPSQQIRILGGFDVAEDGSTEIILDFDAEKSLNKLGNGDWLMTPIIIMTGVDTDSGD